MRWKLLILLLMQPNSPKTGFRSRLRCQISFEMLEDQPHDQVGCWRSLCDERNSWEPPSACRPCQTVVRVLPCILVIGEASLAGSLIMRLIFEHLERKMEAQKQKTNRKGHGPGSPGPGPGQDQPFLKQFLAWQVPPLVFWAFALVIDRLRAPNYIKNPCPPLLC